MKFCADCLKLYAVTDRRWLKGISLPQAVEEAVKSGVTMVQLREKNMDFEEFTALAKEVKKVTDKYKVPFVINDNVAVALACDADGVHVGQSDMCAFDVRAKIGPEKILGVSARTTDQAMLAAKMGADYVGIGAVFSTGTKNDAEQLSLAEVKKICAVVPLPAVAIGGITKSNITMLKGSGADGAAVVSAIFASDNIASAAAELRVLADEITR